MAAGTLIESYQNSLNIKYSLEDANEIQIIMWLQELSNESSRLNKLYNESETNIDSYAISGCMRVVDELCDNMGNKLKEIFIGKYTKHIKNTYPFETASDSDLVIMIAGLVCEIKKQEIECHSNKNMDILFSIYSQQKQIAQTAATNACLRLEKLNRSLYNSPEVQKWVQQIDPNLKGGFLLAATRLRTQLAELKDRPKVIVEQFQNDIEERFSKWMDAIKAKSEKITEKIQSLVDSFNK
jgi:hypothetical protein